MSITKKHRYQKFANQTLYWLDSDGHSNWKQHQANDQQRAQLKKYGFDQENSFTYEMNSHGFRSAEFSDTPGFIALGCSFTCGVGLPIQQVWPSMVAEACQLTAWNLGIGSASLDTCYRMLVNYLDQLNPKFVMLLIPDTSRFEIQHQDNPVWFLPNCSPDDKIFDNLQKIWYSDPQNSLINQSKNIQAMQYLCDQRGVKFIANKIYFRGADAEDQWPSARDLLHSGFQEQKNIANDFMTGLEKR